MNFRFWPKNPSEFLRRPFFFGLKKRLNLRVFREIPYQFSDKPCDSDSRPMKIRVRAEMETGRIDRQVGLPVGSRFFDRPVKPVEISVKFSFLDTKRHRNTNRNILTYFIINKSFYKKAVLTNLTF